jgi:hypothetical protein
MQLRFFNCTSHKPSDNFERFWRCSFGLSCRVDQSTRRLNQKGHHQNCHHVKILNLIQHRQMIMNAEYLFGRNCSGPISRRYTVIRLWRSSSLSQLAVTLRHKRGASCTYVYKHRNGLAYVCIPSSLLAVLGSRSRPRETCDRKVKWAGNAWPSYRLTSVCTFLT